MSEKSRKSFTSHHKAKVAIEGIRGVKTVNEIAQQFSVHPNQVGQWGCKPEPPKFPSHSHVANQRNRKTL